jgi:hypothetical protein
MTMSDASKPDGVNSAPAGAGEGDAYPNPHTGKKPRDTGFMGHGGQSEIGYHGSGQLGDDDVEGENANAPTEGD